MDDFPEIIRTIDDHIDEFESLPLKKPCRHSPAGLSL